MPAKQIRKKTRNILIAVCAAVQTGTIPENSDGITVTFGE